MAKSSLLKAFVVEEDTIFEATQFKGDESIKEIYAMLDAAKKAIGLINKLKVKADRKKHASEVFKNLNRIRTVLIKMIDETPRVEAPRVNLFTD